MIQAVNMGKDVMIMPMSSLCTGCMGVGHFVVLRIEQVRKMGDLILPDGFECRIMRLQLIDPHNPSPAIPRPVLDQHPVAEKFPADGGAIRVDDAQKSLGIFLRVHKYASLPGGILPVILHLFEFIGEFICIIGVYMDVEEFVRDPIPAKIIMTGYLPLHFDKITYAHTAFPTPVTIELHHSNFKFMLIRIIKIGI
jgi:hypothetical protein